MSKYAVAKISNLNQLRTELARRAPLYRQVMPPGTSIERFTRGIVLAAKNNPDILDCTPDSILESAMRLAILGLEVGAGGGWIIKYGNRASMQTDYRGEIKLALQHPMIASIKANCVYEGEPFDYKAGTVDSIHHEVRLDVDRSDAKVVGAYAVAYFTNCAPPQVFFMNRKEIEKVRGSSHASDSLMWSKWFCEGCRKTVLRRLCKTLPKSTALELAHRAEAMAEDGTSGHLPGLDDWKEHMSGAAKQPRDEVSVTIETEGQESAEQPCDSAAVDAPRDLVAEAKAFEATLTTDEYLTLCQKHVSTNKGRGDDAPLDEPTDKAPAAELEAFIAAAQKVANKKSKK